MGQATYFWAWVCLTDLTVGQFLLPIKGTIFEIKAASGHPKSVPGNATLKPTAY